MTKSKIGAIIYKNRQLEVLMEKKLFGKNIVWLGSSVTYGHANGGVSMVEYLAEKTDAICTKYALSGKTLANIDDSSYIARLDRIRGDQKCDLFICQLSTNDASKGVPLGSFADIDDEKTVVGAIYRVIRTVRERFDCSIAFYTNPPYDSLAYEKMVDIMRSIAAREGVLLLDLWDDPPFAESERGIYMADPIHPNEQGYRLLTPIFEKFVAESFCNE